MAKQTATQSEEAAEQAFLAKQAAKPAPKETAAAPKAAPKDATEHIQQDTVPGYSGSPHEGLPPPVTVPPDAMPDTVASPIGLTYPTLVYAGNGITLHETSPGQPPPPDMHPPGEEG